jgi:UDP-N-acetylmuramyl tripeptide synthase
MKKGSSKPGQVALKLCPDILSKIKLPKNVIVVTGSNGKTSTTELIYNVLSNNGLSVGCNLEGSNQTEGVTTMILNNCNLKGVVTKDALVIESDERYLRHTLKFFKPNYLVVTNLYRDQMTRNGHPEHIFEIIKEAGLEDIHLILNADDPLSSLYGFNRDNVTYFGMNKTSISKTQNDGCYNDGIYCPNCKQKMEYDYYNYAHIGGFRCQSCGHKRHEPDFAVTGIDLKSGEVEINKKYKLKLSMRSIYMAYNFLSAFAAAKLVGIEEDKIINSLTDYIIKNDRIQKFKIADHEGMLLTSKHENSIAYNQSIEYIVKENRPCTVVVIVDQVSRKYYTSETSWIWDIDFERLNAACVNKIILAGKYVDDLIIRAKYSNMDNSKIESFESLDEMMNCVKEKAVGDIYVVTCFTDRDKFMNRI